jgi:Zn-dependent protease with chaperone function
VLEHPAPLAWCLPGQAAPVIVSTAALDRLDPEGLRAVLAHERAHQASRHHALLLVAKALRVGCPWLPAARVGRRNPDSCREQGLRTIGRCCSCSG